MKKIAVAVGEPSSPGGLPEANGLLAELAKPFLILDTM
jgi:hypothetical protein